MKTSYLVEQQVPEFVLTNYPAFVDFIKAYYQWVEQEHNIGKIESLIDIEETIEAFLQYFRKELDVFGVLSKTNNRFFLKNIKQLYKAKGSESAFKFFFRLVYGKEISINYPWDRTLKVSDGKWQQEAALFIKVISGSPETIVGKNITLNTGDKSYNINIERYEPIEMLENGIKTINPDTYQFFVNREFYNKIPKNVRVTYGSQFLGVTTTTTTAINISYGGQGFRVGELYDLNDAVGSGSVIKILEIYPNGRIKSAQIVKFGSGYKDNFSISLLPKIIHGTINYGTISSVDDDLDLATITTNENYLGILEKTFINAFDYNIDPGNPIPALDPTYAGKVLGSSFYDNNTSEIIDPKYVAEITINSQTVAKYPGYFLNNDGFCSDDMFLQDNYYYQVYSYEIVIEEQLKKYKSLLKDVLHPTGIALFGKYDLRNEFDLSATIQEAGSGITPVITYISTELPTDILIPATDTGNVYFTDTLYYDISYTVDGYFSNIGSGQSF